MRRVLRDRWDILLVIAGGGALGSVARWAMNQGLPTGRHQMAWSTWLENVSGALLLGALMVFVVDVWPPTRYVRPFVGVGILGGYTTFSAYMLDTRTLLDAGEPGRAGLYLFGTLLTGMAAVWVGLVTARTVVSVVRNRQRHRHLDEDVDVADRRSVR